MNFVGVDLHKKTISLCVVRILAGTREVVARRRFDCQDTATIRKFFEDLGTFWAVVEATANYEWFLLLIEDLADRCVLAHPKKLRVIAECKHKSDKVDAQVLAEFLAMDMIPEAYRPSPRIRQYRVLVRHRRWLQGRIAAIKCKLRDKAAHYNADIAELFTLKGEEHLAELAMSMAYRFHTAKLLALLEFCQRQLEEADAELGRFAKTAAGAEREARAVLDTMPEVGPVTIDIVLSELGDWRRFRSAKRVVSFAGLDPGYRESDGKGKRLPITKEGSPLLRWAMIETAWRLVRKYARWRRIYDQYGIKEKGDCGRSPTSALRDVRHVAGWERIPSRSPGGIALAPAPPTKAPWDAFSVARPSLADSLRSNRASERRPAPTKAPTHRSPD